ncbi:hypothetical protein H1S01_11245 [Heliobacterium chlorum]|uniref:Uncharacterized protein n=1 Tax=Heliobacterium chlorum TaxID=2698 RepID=A0ABR7T2T4_HELCL|nr:hypothetical protein [Heliobacterium chlorum]MBC9785083.1 hypothetical protein [Heliobacterium chlorum]
MRSILKKANIRSIILTVLLILYVLIWIELDYRNTEEVTYRGRAYKLGYDFYEYLPLEHINMLKISQPTGEHVNGYEVYSHCDIAEGQTRTVLYLKRKDGRFRVYGLIGGP